MTTQRLDHSELCVDGLKAEDQDQLIAILDQYLIDMEEGRNPDVEELITAYPHLAEALRTYLTGLDLIREVTTTESRRWTTEEVSLSDAYDLGEELGRGAMGIVYRGVHKESGEAVAVKILALGTALDDQMIARFLREAESARSLVHSNIVPVMHVGCDNGVYFYAMKLIEGLSLDRHIDQARIERRRGSEEDSLLSSSGRYEAIAKRYAEVAHALHAVHQAGVVHRDIKPSNILRDGDGKLWVTDFGLARIVQNQDLTKTGDLIGTYRYMSPEQARGRPDLIGPHTDVYGLGATLYELLTLRPVFRGQDTIRLLNRIHHSRPQLPSHWDPNIPKDLETIVLRSIDPDHTMRYQTAEEFAEDLDRFAKGKKIRARRPWRVPHSVLRFMPTARQLGMVATTLVCLTGLIWFAQTAPAILSTQNDAADSDMISELTQLRLEQVLHANQTPQQLRAHYEETLLLVSGSQNLLARTRWRVRTLNQWAIMEMRGGDLLKAQALLERAAEQLESLPKNELNQEIGLVTLVGQACIDLGTASDLDIGFVQHAKAPQGAALAGDVEQLVLACNLLVAQCMERELLDEAIDISLLAQRRVDALANPSPWLACQAAILSCQLADSYFDRGDLGDSESAYRDSIEILAKMIAQSPGDPHLEREISISLNNLGRCLTAQNRPQDAENAFNQAISHMEGLIREGSGDAKTANQAADILINCGVLLTEQRRYREAREAFLRAEAILNQVENETEYYKNLLSTVQSNLAKLPENDTTGSG